MDNCHQFSLLYTDVLFISTLLGCWVNKFFFRLSNINVGKLCNHTVSDPLFLCQTICICTSLFVLVPQFHWSLAKTFAIFKKLSIRIVIVRVVTLPFRLVFGTFSKVVCSCMFINTFAPDILSTCLHARECQSATCWLSFFVWHLWRIYLKTSFPKGIKGKGD